MLCSTCQQMIISKSSPLEMHYNLIPMNGAIYANHRQVQTRFLYMHNLSHCKLDSRGEDDIRCQQYGYKCNTNSSIRRNRECNIHATQFDQANVFPLSSLYSLHTIRNAHGLIICISIITTATSYNSNYVYSTYRSVTICNVNAFQDMRCIMLIYVRRNWMQHSSYFFTVLLRIFL